MHRENEYRQARGPVRGLTALLSVPKQPPGHRVRINDDPNQTFGTFPVDQPFTLAVNVEVAASSGQAQVSLLGNGTAGNSPNITIPDGSLAAQLGATRFWIGWPWRGHFEANNIIVTHKSWCVAAISRGRYNNEAQDPGWPGGSVAEQHRLVANPRLP